MKNFNISSLKNVVHGSKKAICNELLLTFLQIFSYNKELYGSNDLKIELLKFEFGQQ